MMGSICGVPWGGPHPRGERSRRSRSLIPASDTQSVIFQIKYQIRMFRTSATTRHDP